MKPTSMQTRITVRLDNELEQELEILHKWSNVDKAKIVRMILKDFFKNNSDKLDKYYEENKTE
jgi:predicted DNA-binding protein